MWEHTSVCLNESSFVYRLRCSDPLFSDHSENKVATQQLINHSFQHISQVAFGFKAVVKNDDGARFLQWWHFGKPARY